MNEWDSPTVDGLPPLAAATSVTPPPIPFFRDPESLLQMSRGFSCIFWSLPLLASAHTLAQMSLLPLYWTIGLLMMSYLPLLGGLWMLRDAGSLTPKWGRKIEQAALLAIVAMVLYPFLSWWSMVPTRFYFAANAAVHYGVMIGLLTSLNQLVGESARGMGDMPLRRESKAGVIMVLWLSFCTVGALVWLLHRSGLLEAGIPAVLAQMASLSPEARTLFLLPYAMTAYVLWRGKEVGFRCAVRPAP